jgi:hypothetical protein
MLTHPTIAMLAFFQGTQLSLFERFLTQAVSGINSTSITSGMQSVAYVVLLVGFLWQVYQAALHGGDARGLGTNLIKYVATAVVVMNYPTVFTTVNQGFVNAGNWISNASGAGNLFENWATDLQTQFNQVGVQKLWGLITGDIPGLLDAILIIIAYILYPIVIVIFGFFYIFYGSVLYIFGPVVIGLMPLGATSRIAKAYIENVFIWNAWPILYGGFGALLSAVQMGQIGQMLNQNNFLGGLGNIEGAFLIGIASIVYSLAIAVIPFIAKRIVSGDVGSTAAALIGMAATALTVGAAAVEGAAVGAASAGAGGSSASSAAGRSATSSATAGSALGGTGSATANLPTPPQSAPKALAAASQDSSSNTPASAGRFSSEGSPTLEGHADQMREFIGDAVGATAAEEAASGDPVSTAASGGSVSKAARSSSPTGGARPAAAARRGPTVHRYNLGTWGAFHAARIATGTVANVARLASGKTGNKSNT